MGLVVFLPWSSNQVMASSMVSTTLAAVATRGMVYIPIWALVALAFNRNMSVTTCPQILPASMRLR